MGRRPATIRDANAVKAGADEAARRRKHFQSAASFAMPLLLLCVPMLRAQGSPPVLSTVSGVTTAIAINSDNSAGQTYNAVLNSDSSVSLLGNGAIVSGQNCPAFSGLSGSLSAGAVYLDSANSRVYLAMISGDTLYAAYDSIGLGSCTSGPLLQLATNALSNLEMNVDAAQGSVYILNSYGAFPDKMYILSTASWPVSSAEVPALTMDYSVPYGPIVIDPSNHVVYINDLGGNAFGNAGTYGTSGFFVYDPNLSTTPANNLQHVVGYNTSGGTTPFNVGTLLSNGSGELVLVNENPTASSTNLSVPITILNATAPQTLFFTNTTKPYSYNNDVDITPGADLSTISAVSQYRAIGAADINTASNLVYVYGYNSTSLLSPGLLLEYNLASGASPQETVLSNSAAMPNLYHSSEPWSQLNYDPESTELALSAGTTAGTGGLALTSPLCAGTPVTLTQVAGNISSATPIGFPVVNAVSGYVYALQSGSIDYVAPPSGCSASPPIQISPASLIYGFEGESYFESFTATGGSGTGYTWSVTSGTGLSAVGLSLSTSGAISGTPTGPETAAAFTVQVTDSLGNTATQTYALTIYPDLSVTPSAIPTGTVGTVYSITLFASGGAGSPYTFNVISGTALSAVGLTLSSAGVISGTPTAPETAAAFTVKVSDSLGDFSQFNYTLTINSASSGPISINDPETVTVNDSATQVYIPDVSDPERITVTDTPIVTVSGPLNITTAASAPSGYVGVPYAPIALFTASGGSTPYTWSATGLPAGLSINSSTGVISGTPTAAGNFLVNVAVTDSRGNSVFAPSPLNVFPAPTITGPASLPTGYVGAMYAATTITASGGSGVYTWSAIGLPPGLSINASTGVISGTPTADSGSPYSVTVKVTDSAGNSATKNYSLAVDLLLIITGPASLPSGYVGAMYAATTITASGGSGVYTWSAIGLPPGLSINASTGVISGTPTADSGSPYSVTVKVTDSAGNSATKNYSLAVDLLLIITGPASLPSGYVGVMYTATTITASGGSGVYTWSATGLPPGLTVGTTTGVISGTPTAPASASVIVTVTDTNGNTALRPFSLTVDLSSLAINTTSPLPGGQVNVAYSAPPFAASGGTTPYAWSATGLPAGLSINVATGAITGTPTAAGGFTPKVTVTDALGSSTSANFSLTIIPPPLLTITLNPGSVTIVQGQSGATVLTFTPMNGYVGTLTLGCIGNPANTQCLFTINGAPVNSVALTGNNQPVNVTLTIKTDVNPQQAWLESRPTPLRPQAILTAIAFWCPGSLLGVMALRRKRKLFTGNPRVFGLCLFVLLAGALAGLAGCISGGGFGTYVTPVGNSTMTIAVTPASGSAQTVSLAVTITQQ